MSAQPSRRQSTVVAAGADLHGHLPEVPACDLLVLAGDLVPYDIERDHDATRAWFAGPFAEWLERSPAAETVAIAGNHDFWALDVPEGAHAGLHGAPWTYLRDTAFTSATGLSLYGSPWTPEVYGTAFEAPAAELERRWSAIPDGLDLLVVHCPPRGRGDHLANPEGPPTLMGAEALDTAIRRTRPRQVVYGHAHEAYGYRSEDDPPGTALANVTVRTDYTGGLHRLSSFTLEGR